jgi:hypothetical protein
MVSLLILMIAAEGSPFAEIRVVDAVTGRGVPLVELETVNSLRLVTDNAGRIAFQEPGLMGRELFFSVHGHGYEVAKDGFGIAGVRVTPRAGTVTTVKVQRRNRAERLCRLTGEGRYRDTLLLGHKPPRDEGANPGQVAGQDSVQAIEFAGKVYWFWGDTLRMNYPLGLFRMAGATTPRFDLRDPKSDPATGIAFDYFVDKTGFARAMMPLPERPQGVLWVEALAVVPDADGKERLIGHYSRRKGLVGEYEQGIARFDEGKALFTVARELPLKETWRRPRGHPIVWESEGKKWLLMGSPSPNVRVPATLADVLDPTRYEALTCLKDSPEGKPVVDRDGKGQVRWRWQKEREPLDSKGEQALLKAGTLRPEEARFCPADREQPKTRVTLHSGSVRWNAYRKKWVMVACQIGGKASFLGEVWYAEADQPTGPFAQAVQVLSHDKQTFYNVCHHAFLDRDDGRTIHFEGTYTNDFSGNPYKTPRYNYNQVLYRLSLDTLEKAKP